MDLRPRQRQSFSGFIDAEVQKMKKLLNEFKEQSMDEEFCKNLARVFSRASGRAGKPVVKWTEIQSWFQKNQRQGHSQSKATGNPNLAEGEKVEYLSRLEFEARSSQDGAWYDVDTFVSHRFLSSGEIEVCVRYVGFGTEDDEWVSARDSLRVRSIALEDSECHKVKVGDLVLCFQEQQDQDRYYDARVIEIQKRWHDIRGCRCLFLIRYEHDNEEETVRLRRLCCRPYALA